MELWNDFEGKTVDGRFQLDHLIGPKGRSAYFTTKDEGSGPAVIRLIESLNDEEEILARWRTVTGLRQEHLVAVLACGQTVIDGTHLVYAVMEPTDAELADVLRERALTADETRQVALSVADGLEVLHAKGLVHEHVEAENVLAKDELIKLRSDVVRAAPEGAEGAALRAKDVRDLSLLLMQCLTRSRRLGEARLPVPFEEVIRKGESGAWGLSEIVAALRPGAAVTRPAGQAAGAPAVTGRAVAAPARGGAAPVPGGGTAAAAGGGAAGAGRSTAGAAPMVSPGAVGAAGMAGAVGSAPAAVASRLANQPGARQGEGLAAHLRSPRSSDRIVMEPAAEPKRRGLLAAIVVGALLLVFLGIYFFRGARSGQSRTAVQNTPSAATAPEQSGENRPPAHDAASAPAPQGGESSTAGAGQTRTEGVQAGGAAAGSAAGSVEGGHWRVVAFTYNREDQATRKVQALAAKHPGLKPEVYTPTGKAPYLVTLGGWMSAEEASAMRNRARSAGLPRDVYTRNYQAGGGRSAHRRRR